MVLDFLVHLPLSLSSSPAKHRTIVNNRIITLQEGSYLCSGDVRNRRCIHISVQIPHDIRGSRKVKNNTAVTGKEKKGSIQYSELIPRRSWCLFCMSAPSHTGLITLHIFLNEKNPIDSQAGVLSIRIFPEFPFSAVHLKSGRLI